MEAIFDYLRKNHHMAYEQLLKAGNLRSEGSMGSGAIVAGRGQDVTTFVKEVG